MSRAERAARRRKELRNKVVTRGDLQEILNRYDKANVAGLRRWMEWKRAPIYRRAWALTKAWCKREWTWPPRRPRWARLPRWLRSSPGPEAS